MKAYFQLNSTPAVLLTFLVLISFSNAIADDLYLLAGTSGNPDEREAAYNRLQKADDLAGFGHTGFEAQELGDGQLSLEVQ